MAYYRNGNRRNYFFDVGAGAAVVLLHGITNSGRAWAPQISPLVQSGYRVIIPDHAGHGASQRLTQPVGVQELAEDTLALLDHLALPSVSIVGLSLGGMVAMQLTLLAPSRVQRLVVANSFDTTDTDAFRAMARTWAETLRREDGPVARLEATWPINVNEAFRQSPEGLRTYQVWHGIAASGDGTSLACVAEGISGFDVREKLSALSLPTLFIAGSDDVVSSPVLSRAMVARVRGAHYEELDRAAHLSNVDSAEAFNGALLRFLSNE